jgi:hypothetical protein
VPERILIRHVVQIFPGITEYKLPVIQGQVVDVVELGEFQAKVNGDTTLTEQRVVGASFLNASTLCLSEPPTKNTRYAVVIDGHMESALHA